MAACQRALTPTLPPGSAECGSSVSSVRLYRDQWSILSIEFNYKDGDSSDSGNVTELYDELVLESSECLVRIVQYMDLNETDGDGSGHKRRVELTTSSGRTVQTTAVHPPTPDVAPLVLQAPPSMCITDAWLNTDAGPANALTEASFSAACKEDSGGGSGKGEDGKGGSGMRCFGEVGGELLQVLPFLRSLDCVRACVFKSVTRCA